MAARPAAGSPKARVLRWLARRDRSEREIRARLSEWEVPADEADALLEELLSRGYVNDAVLAEKICDWHRRHDPMGPYRLRDRLRRRGIPDGHADAALAPFREPELQRELAARLVEKRLPALAGLPSATRWRRLCDYLNRRGFDAGVVRELTDPILAEAEADAEE